MGESGGIFGESQVTDYGPEDSQTIEAMEEAFEDSQGLEMQVEAMPEPGVHFPAEEEAEEVSEDLEDLVLDADESLPNVDEEAEEEIVSLDLDDLSVDETETAFDEQPVEKDSISELELEEADEALSLEKETLSLEDVGISPAADAETVDKEDEISLDFSDLSIEEPESDEITVVESEEELEMELDDLLLDEAEPEEEAPSKGTVVDTGELITSEIDINKLKDSEDMEDFELELEPLEPEDK
jgi:hypothetical protein